ncbi:MAG TPA: efflux RND transporter periplasmic adaptor subunit [Thermoanaerobaculia bacterium]
MSKRKAIYGTAAAILAALVIIAFIPEPVPVETAAVVRGSMTVTVDQEGKTRVVDRFVIAAPAAGRLQHIELREGAAVRPGDVVARIAPAPLEPARRRELTALVTAAESALGEAQAAAKRAEAAHALARRELQRAEALTREGVAAASALDEARAAEETARREVAAARSAVGSARSNLEAARARVLSTSRSGTAAAIDVRSPVAGRVLRVPERSERVVAPGETILELGDASAIELVIDVLSEDAVKSGPGAPVIVEEWGGDAPLRGRVRVIEPSAFTKISALGIEEQRVNVIASVDDPPPQLGDAYRVEARIVVWSDDGALQVPVSALGRKGDAWSVYVLEEGRARERAVRIGQRNSRVAQVLEGLKPGERVILHPGNDVADGVRVAARE